MNIVFWFRRDLRLQDNQALTHAASLGTVSAVYAVPANFATLTPIRQHSLVESLKSLSADLPQGLGILDSLQALAAFAKSQGAAKVVATRAHDTTGMLEQAELAELLYAEGIALDLVGSNYAVEPGTIFKDDGSPLKVYTPFYKRWMQAGWERPFVLDVKGASWGKPQGVGNYPVPSGPAPFQIKAGEAFALRTFARFAKRSLNEYNELRNRPDLSGTSHLSHALAHGEIHPRTLLVQLGDSGGHETYRKELAWREFYADVMFHNPHTLDDYYNPDYAAMRYADPVKDAARLTAWEEGRTGFPIVDAAMRQLRQTGWMHNRSRMIVASFLVKDLHFEWQVGARHFEKWLTDFDPASNSHGWQWTAGCGTDASPYYRVFNPTLQGEKFDPNGDYVRKYVPELAHIAGSAIHQPWLLIDGLSNGYPAPIVDHSVERDEALARLKALKS
jgi:deoxyribodipyrimidine photo-lyase